MASYILARLLWTIPVLLFVSLITFALMHSVEGGPWDREKKLPDAVEAIIRDGWVRAMNTFNTDPEGFEEP